MDKKPKAEITEFVERHLEDLSAEEFAAARRSGAGPVATLLMPTERKSAETRKNHIVFKNVLREAREMLAASSRQCDQLAARLEALERFDQETHPFWQNQDRGLAMVVEPFGRVTAYKLPFAPTAYVRVDSQPYLSPLLRLTSGGTYYVLLLDLGLIRLFRASRWKIDEIPLQGMPGPRDLNGNGLPKDLQMQNLAANAMPGQGDPDDPDNSTAHPGPDDEMRDVRLRKFMENVNARLPEHLDNRELPLLLFGPEHLVGNFRRVNSYPHLLDAAIFHNPSHLGRDELHEIVRKKIEELDARTMQDWLNKLQDGLGLGQATASFEEVVKAASDGRVATLFVKAGERAYGLNDRARDSVTIRKEPIDGDIELVGTTAATAAETGARIIYLENGHKLPGDGRLAAILRY